MLAVHTETNQQASRHTDARGNMHKAHDNTKKHTTKKSKNKKGPHAHVSFTSLTKQPQPNRVNAHPWVIRRAHKHRNKNQT